VKDALDLIKYEVIPGHRNRAFNFIMRMKLLILQDSFQYAEKPKVARAQVRRIGWVRQSCNVILVEFWQDFSPIEASSSTVFHGTWEELRTYNRKVWQTFCGTVRQFGLVSKRDEETQICHFYTPHIY
jgi:hypothetical protein